MKEIDFTAFEEAFKLNPVPMNKARDSIDNAAKTPTVKVPYTRRCLMQGLTEVILQAMDKRRSDAQDIP
jgi:hypothetical protein